MRFLSFIFFLFVSIASAQAQSEVRFSSLQDREWIHFDEWQPGQPYGPSLREDPPWAATKKSVMQNLEHLGCRELSTEEIKCGVGHFIFGKQGGLHTVYYTAESQLKTKLFVDNILVLEGSEIKLSHEKLIAMGFEYIQEYYPEDEFDVVANDNRYVISNEFLILILYPEGVESLRALFPLPAVEIRNKKDY